MSTERLIARLDTWLKEHRPADYAALQPGMSGHRLREFERDIGFDVPDAFKELYAWRNGQDPKCFAALQHNRMFMSIENVLDRHRMMNELLEGGSSTARCGGAPNGCRSWTTVAAITNVSTWEKRSAGSRARSSVSGTIGNAGISSITACPSWRTP